ncbi:MAG TPA: hypothetical protein VFD01_23340 [Candidatus Dormibacteraeota bacterium]|jgi:hypothetical protein|nr:hypothetical protein [Candidatus Dormibacteraeota bacterium]
MSRGKRARIAIGVVASLLVAGSYLGAGLLVTRGAMDGTEHTVATVIRDLDGSSSQLDGLNSAFQLPANLQNAQDTARARKTIDTSRGVLEHTQTAIEADLHRLQSADAELRSQAGNPLLVPYRSLLDDERHRLGHVADALGATRDLIQTGDQQLRVVSAILEVLGALLQLTARLDRNDISGALADDPQLEASAQQLVQQSRATPLPAVLRDEIATLATLVTDLGRFLQAARAHDLSTVDQLSSKLDQDEKTMAGYDPNLADRQEAQLLQPYRDRIQRSLKAIGAASRG